MIVCISWNNKSVFDAMHGANMKIFYGKVMSPVAIKPR